MKIKGTCRYLTLIAAVVMMFTVFAAFSGIGAAEAYAAAETKMNIKGILMLSCTGK